MKTWEKFTKTEVILLVITLLFLLATGAVWFLETGRGETGYYIRTEGVPETVSVLESDDGSTDAPALPAPTAEHPLNINTADADMLALLPHIGPVLAERIVADRTENGPFAKKEDLMRVKGIGEKTYEKLQDLITVEENAA